MYIVKIAALTMFIFDACGSLREPPSTTEFFPNIRDNLTTLTWAHAVNNASYLEDVLRGDIMMIEADIILGRLIDDPQGTLQPVMGHPPENTSDISLQRFLERINESNENTKKTMKGVKLDFKSIEVFEESLEIVNDLYQKVQYPLWINADILPGPGNSQTRPVDAGRFLEASAAFPAAELSVGWTTLYGGDLAEGSYSGDHVAAMKAALVASDVEQTVTFPVRAGLAARSLPVILDLLDSTAPLRSTITVWSSAGDSVDIPKLNRLILTVGLNRVYLDVPKEVSDKLDL